MTIVAAGTSGVRAKRKLSRVGNGHVNNGSSNNETRGVQDGPSPRRRRVATTSKRKLNSTIGVGASSSVATSASAAAAARQQQQPSLGNVDLLCVTETLLKARPIASSLSNDDITRLLLDPSLRSLDETPTTPTPPPPTDDSTENGGGGGGTRAKRARLENGEEDAIATAYLDLLMRVLIAAETALGQLQFSKEALKYYLSTYDGLVRHMDFNGVPSRRRQLNDQAGAGDETSATAYDDEIATRPHQQRQLTNSAAVTGRKKRPDSQLAPGAILGEYARSLDAFLAGLGRATSNDARALRLILEHGIRIPSDLYAPAHLVEPFVDARYIDVAETPSESGGDDDADATTSDDVCLSVGNGGQFKRSAVLLTRHVLLVYDAQQQQFAMPPSTLEREISSATLFGLPENSRYVLDMLLSGSGGSGKCRVIDVLDSPERSPDYVVRMDALRALAPSLRRVERIEDPGRRAQQENRLYVKARSNERPSVVRFCAMPWPVAAAVGLQNRRVLLAFRDFEVATAATNRSTTEEYLRVRLRCSPLGSTALALLSRARRRVSSLASSLGSIRTSDGRETRVVYDSTGRSGGGAQADDVGSDEDSDEDRCVLFDEAIPVELRDANGTPRIGAIVRSRPVARSADYRPHGAAAAAAAAAAQAAASHAAKAAADDANVGSRLLTGPTLTEMSQDTERFVDQIFCLPNWGDIVSLIQERRSLIEFDDDAEATSANASNAAATVGSGRHTAPYRL